MSQQERFEAQYADQHDVPVEAMAQYRMGDSYRLPGMASHYRTFKAAEDGLLKDAERHRWLRRYEFDIGSFHGVHEHNAKAWFEHIDDEAIDLCIVEEAAFAVESAMDREAPDAGSTKG